MSSNVEFDDNFQIFETFTVEEQIEELKGFVECPHLSVFDDKNIVIATPSFDEYDRYIKNEDKELYFVQKRDARQLSSYIMNNTRANSAIVVTNSSKLDSIVDSSSEPIDFLILLHEFMPEEQDFAIDQMKRNHLGIAVNENLRVIEVC